MTENTGTENADLSWLSTVEPVKTTMRTSRRGRQPGKNPVAGHVKLAHESGDTLSLPVPANKARQTERMLRRAALRDGWSISVQVLSKHPDQAMSDDVIALKDLSALPEGSDVWVSFTVTDKVDESPADSGDSDGIEPGPETTDATADPFAGAPESPATESTEPAPEPTSGRRSRKGRAA